MPDITDLLDRTTPTDLAPVDVAAVARQGRRRQHRRRAAVVAAPVVVLALAVAVNAARTDDSDAVSVSDGEGTLPPLPQTSSGEDMAVFLKGTITQETFDALEQKLADDVRVVEFEYMDTEASMEEYRRIFAGNPEMLDAAEQNPELVPASFRLRLVDERHDAVIALMEEYAVLDGVMRVTSPLGETPETP